MNALLRFWSPLLLGGALLIGCKGGNNPGNADGGDGDLAGGAFSIVSRSVPLAVGSTECEHGGTRVDVGLDNGDGGGTARDGILQDGEVDRHENVCNPSAPAFDTVTRTTTLAAGDTTCPFGGSLIEYGVDDGSGGGTADNAVLETGEVDGKTYACLPKPDDLLVISVAIPSGDPDCPYGGHHIQSGRDDGKPGGTAADTILQSEEIDLDEKRCNADPTSPFPVTTGAAGALAIDLHGGVGAGAGSANTGGNGGSLFVQLLAGPLPASLEVRTQGTLGVTIPDPTVAVTAGSNPVILSSDAVIDVVATPPDPVTNKLYVLGTMASDTFALPLYFNGAEATSLQIQEGVKVTFREGNGLGIRVSIAGDVRVAGTLTTLDTQFHAALRVSCRNFFVDATGLVDQRGESLEVFAARDATSRIVNRGRILTRGYDKVGDPLTTLPEDVDGDPDASTGTHNPGSPGGTLKLLAINGIYNSGTIASRGTRAPGTDVTTYEGRSLVLYTSRGELQNTGTIDASGGTSLQGGTGGSVLLATNRSFFSDVLPTLTLPDETPQLLIEEQGPGGLASTGTITSRGGDAGAGGTGQGGAGNSITIQVAGGALRLGGSVVTAGGVPLAGRGGAGGSLSLQAKVWVDADGAISVPDEIVLAAAVDARGRDAVGTFRGGNGGGLSVVLDVLDGNRAYDPQRLADLVATRPIGIRFRGYGSGINQSGGDGQAASGRGGDAEVKLRSCPGVGSFGGCAFPRVGERWLFGDVGWTATGGKLDTGTAGRGGGLQLELRSGTEFGTVFGASLLQLGGAITRQGGAGATGTGAGGAGGQVAISADVAHVAITAPIDLRGGASTTLRSGAGGALLVAGFDVQQSGTVDLQAGASTSLNVGDAGAYQLFGYRAHVSGDVTLSGNGTVTTPSAGSFSLNVIETLTLDGNLNGRGIGQRSGHGGDGAALALDVGQGSGTGTIDLRGGDATEVNSSTGQINAGSGGRFVVTARSWLQSGAALLDGGDCTTAAALTCNGGKGGNLDSSWNYSGAGPLHADGGDATASIAGANANGGAGGFLELQSNSGSVSSNGGNATASGGTPQGGAGGLVSIEGANTGCVTVTGGTPGGLVGLIQAATNVCGD